MNLKSIYDITPEILEWLNHTLIPIEEPVFTHYKGIQHLTNIVDRAEIGLASKFAAFTRIEDHNLEHKTHLTYDEIRDRINTYVFCDLGKWAAYVENIVDQRLILDSPYKTAEDAFKNAHPDISWIVLLLPFDEVVVVYRSPYVGQRQIYDQDTLTAWGESSGEHPAFTLPPQLEACLGMTDSEEIFQQYPNRSRADAR